MSEGVGYTPGTGTTVAADLVLGDLYQRVKIVIGSDGTVLGDVDVTRPMPVSGTVSVSGPVQISGTVTAGAGTTVVSLTGQAQVSGTVSISGAMGVSGSVSFLDIVPVTTQVSVSVSGLPVWMNPTQGVTILGVQSVNTIVAGFSVNALVTGVVSVSVLPAVSISVSAVLGTIVTVLGTQVVSVVPGLSVLASVNGTINVSGIVPVVTQASVSVSGWPVWMNPTQGVTILGVQSVNTIAAGFSVQALVTGAVSISVMPAVSISVSAVLGTIVTQLGTQMVSIAQTSFSMAALPTVNTIVTILGTQVVSVVPGLSVSAQVLGSVSISGTALVTLVPGGTVNVSGILITATGVTTGTAQAVWIMNPTTVTVTIAGTTTGTVSILNVIPVVTQASASVTGLPVWLAPSQTIGVFPKGDAIAFSFSVVSAATVAVGALCDVAWLGTTVQTSMYVVPAGRTLEIQAIRIIVQNTAASIGIVRGEVFVRMSLSSSVAVGPVVAYANADANTSATNAGGADGIGGIGARIAPGYSVGLGYKVTGGTGHIIGAVIQGVLF